MFNHTKVYCFIASLFNSYQWYWNDAPVETDQVMSYDSSTGILTIKGLTIREEGFYNCRAKNTFPSGMSAVAISQKIEVRVARKCMTFFYVFMCHFSTEEHGPVYMKTNHLGKKKKL